MHGGNLKLKEVYKNINVSTYRLWTRRILINHVIFKIVGNLFTKISLPKKLLLI
jgi:hypothetical protein